MVAARTQSAPPRYLCGTLIRPARLRLPTKSLIYWSGRGDSNPRPRPWQGRALPLSYTRVRLIHIIEGEGVCKHPCGAVRCALPDRRLGQRRAASSRNGRRPADPRPAVRPPRHARHCSPHRRASAGIMVAEATALGGTLPGGLRLSPARRRSGGSGAGSAVRPAIARLAPGLSTRSVAAMFHREVPGEKIGWRMNP